jgi:general secretion pathway protein F
LVVAADRLAVVQQVQRRGHRLLRVEPQRLGAITAGLRSALSAAGRGLSVRDVTEITRELAIMLDAGQDLDRALRYLIETSPAERVRSSLRRVRERLRGGATLAAALSEERSGFSRLYIVLVRAGEASGTLAATLNDLAFALERERAMLSTVRSASIYPAILLIMAIGSIAFLMTYVMPQFTPIFEQAGAALPTATRILMAVADGVTRHGLSLLALAVAAGAGLRLAVRHPTVRRQLDWFWLKCPVLGGLIRQIEAARFTRTLGTLTLNGVGLAAALAIARDVATNRLAIEDIDRMLASVRHGTGLASALTGSAAFPPRTVHLLKLGEDSSRIGELALRAAQIHEDQIRLDLQRLTSVLTPAITVVMGLAVAGIVSALLAAMMSLNDIAL